MPDGRWQFDERVSDVFPDMLERSIPMYDAMRQACFALGVPFVQKGTDIVDLGCSQGDALAPFVNHFGATNHYLGLEVSQPMLAIARQKFAGYIDTGIVDIREHDLRSGYPYVESSLVLSVLTLMFVPIEYRQRLLREIYVAMRPKGALIFVEKVLGSNATIDDALTRSYWNMKKAHGYSEEEITRKRLALEGVLVPMTARWNEEMLRDAGFQSVDAFYRLYNFAGWIAVKS